MDTRSTSSLMILFGSAVVIAAAVALLGWAMLDWRFVNPFLATLVLFAGPFFIGMGVVTVRREQPVWRTDFGRA